MAANPEMTVDVKLSTARLRRTLEIIERHLAAMRAELEQDEQPGPLFDMDKPQPTR